ncbi:hypothetical protein Sgly_2484 [Syntrophobotulus glycolicus DSM 8271]|uniref:TIGR04086 family membrane protein n=1 Tax=Syntrophobotulus glycolicus (strain DSM 8271 / FlGlyR) TaxID=645991 RepID=F0SVY5_SYNGF|nr:hypothetical protein [Syntrophobotulus glycolicus]ADY56769.1 hypothetical protein Sgly_2484 [Syntrophobotulus glycolicus DSM 8271]
MSKSILKGITTGLLVTVLTLLAVFSSAVLGFDQDTITYVIDFGLMLSCLSAGYKAARDSGMLIPAALAAASYALIGILLLALFFPINPSGAISVIGECLILGLLSGILGTGIMKKGRLESGRTYHFLNEDKEEEEETNFFKKIS